MRDRDLARQKHQLFLTQTDHEKWCHYVNVKKAIRLAKGDTHPR